LLTDVLDKIKFGGTVYAYKPAGEEWKEIHFLWFFFSSGELTWILFTGQSTTIEGVNVQGLLPNTDSYITYEGSITMPACFETVTWIVMNKPIYITRQQVRILRNSCVFMIICLYFFSTLVWLYQSRGSQFKHNFTQYSSWANLHCLKSFKIYIKFLLIDLTLIRRGEIEHVS
jgi:hypothetical protein